jgi:hypothetical protein
MSISFFEIHSKNILAGLLWGEFVSGEIPHPVRELTSLHP